MSGPADLLARLARAETEAREALRTLRCVLDDLGAALEQSRQVRAELAAALTPAAPADAPRPGLVIEGGPCGRLEVVR